MQLISEHASKDKRLTNSTARAAPPVVVVHLCGTKCCTKTIVILDIWPRLCFPILEPSKIKFCMFLLHNHKWCTAFNHFKKQYTGCTDHRLVGPHKWSLLLLGGWEYILGGSHGNSLLAYLCIEVPFWIKGDLSFGLSIDLCLRICCKVWIGWSEIVIGIFPWPCWLYRFGKVCFISTQCK